MSNQGYQGSLYYAFNIHRWLKVKLGLRRKPKFILEYPQMGGSYVKLGLPREFILRLQYPQMGQRSNYGCTGNPNLAFNVHRRVVGQARVAQGV